MKKSLILGIFLIAAFIVLAGSASARAFASEQQAITTGYQCLFNITNKSSLSLEEAVFTSFALGFNNVSNNTFNTQKSTSEACWPGTGCDLKRTSQVGIVYDFLNRNTTDIQKWIVNKNTSATGIQWFLEVDIENQIPATCSIREDVDGSGASIINVGADQKLSGNPGSCFTFDRDNYLMRFNDNCVDKSFVISCNEEFLTTTLYKKANSETYYVSADSHTASPDGSTTEKVSAKCFKGANGACDYEGSMWASLALQQFGVDVTPFMPYLIALSDEDANRPFMPAAFIYMLTESSDSYSELTQSQQQNKFWRADANNSRLFDTSLAVLALQGTSAQESTRAKNYLLDIQESNGCWNSKNIRDTAFILYAGWPQPGLPTFEDPDGNGNPDDNNNGGTNNPGSSTRKPPIRTGNSTNSTDRSACELAGYTCSSAFSCLDAGGVLKQGYSCTGRLECCTVKPATQQSCSAQRGTLCAVSQRCEGSSGIASDGTCCFGTCVNIQSEEELNACESGGFGQCRASCGSDEYDTGNTCSTPGYQCCSVSQSESSSSSSWIWITLLIILIIAIGAGIFYRENLKLWWFKMQSKKQPPRSPPGAGASILPRRPPQFGGFAPRPLPTARPGMPAHPAGPAGVRPKAPSPKDKELEDTLKKLKEMSE